MTEQKQGGKVEAEISLLELIQKGDNAGIAQWEKEAKKGDRKRLI